MVLTSCSLIGGYRYFGGTLAFIYKITWCQNTQDQNLNNHIHENLKTYTQIQLKFTEILVKLFLAVA
jgi:hypothetical protein